MYLLELCDDTVEWNFLQTNTTKKPKTIAGRNNHISIALLRTEARNFKLHTKVHLLLGQLQFIHYA